MREYLQDKYIKAVQAGGRFRSFTDPVEEYSSLKSGVGIKIYFDPVIVRMQGKDVLDFIQRISTNSVTGLSFNSARNTLFLNEKGRFIDRAEIVAFDSEFYLIGSEDPAKRLFNWVNKFLIMEDIQTADFSAEYTLLELTGDQTESFLMLIIGKEIGSVADQVVRKFYVDGFEFLIFTFQMTRDLKSYRIFIRSDKAGDFIDYLFNANNIFDLSLAGDDAFETFRIKRAIPSFPNEINDSTNPHEVDLLHEVNFKKGCYIGQEVIARLDTYDKVRRKMFSAVLEGDAAGFTNRTVYENNFNPAGVLTSLSPLKLNDELYGLVLINKKSSEGHEHLFISDGDKKIAVELIR
jgi:tRNA-modifying protein YgfZ